MSCAPGGGLGRARVSRGLLKNIQTNQTCGQAHCAFSSPTWNLLLEYSRPHPPHPSPGSLPGTHPWAPRSSPTPRAHQPHLQSTICCLSRPLSERQWEGWGQSHPQKLPCHVWAQQQRGAGSHLAPRPRFSFLTCRASGLPGKSAGLSKEPSLHRRHVASNPARTRTPRVRGLHILPPEGQRHRCPSS